MLKKLGPSSIKVTDEACTHPCLWQDCDMAISAEPTSPATRQWESSPVPLPQNEQQSNNPGTASKVGLQQSRSPRGFDEEVVYDKTGDTRNIHTPHIQGAAQKPAIAQLVGTAKAVFMSQRPVPPSKPRLEGSSLGCGHAGSRVHWRASRWKAPQGAQAPHADPQSGEFLQSHQVSRSSSNKESGKSEVSHLGQLDGNFQREASGWRRGMSEGKAQPSQYSTLSEQGGDIKRCTVANGSVMKTASELLEEAMRITGTRPGREEEERLQQTPPDEMLSTGDVPMTDNEHNEEAEMVTKAIGLVTGRENTEEMEMLANGQLVRNNGSVENKILVSPLQQSTVDGDIFPDSPEQMTKEVMKSVQSSGKQEAATLQALYHKDRCPSKLAPQRQALTAFLNMADPISQSDPATCSQDDIITATALPQEVRYADMMVVRGCAVAVAQRPARQYKDRGLQSLSFLATWRPKTNVDGYKTIHHLCMSLASQTLPLQLQLASQVCHAPSKLPGAGFLRQQKAANSHISHQADRCRPAQGGHVTLLSATVPETLLDWQKAAELYVETPRMMIHGQMMSLFASEMKMFWKLAPPKFACAPSFIRDKLFPEYQATHHDLTNENLHDDLREVHEPVCGIELGVSSGHTLSRHCRSMEDLTVEEVSAEASCSSTPCDQISVKRPQTTPLFNFGIEAELKVPANFRTVAQELEVTLQQQTAMSLVQQQGALMCNIKLSQRRKRRRRRKKHARTVSGSNTLKPTQVAYAKEKLKEPARSLSRSESVLWLHGRGGTGPCPAVWTHPLSFHSTHRRPSLPLLLDFECFTAQQGGIPTTTTPLEWVREVWAAWSDEPVRPQGERGALKDALVSKAPTPDPPKASQMQILDPERVLDEVDLSQTLGGDLTIAALEAEVASLTQAMAGGVRGSAFDLCRRGALNKKLGHVSLALEDLNSAISLEPNLLDAYWLRHSIHLLRNDSLRALEDLMFITKLKQRHSETLKSKAENYRAQRDTAWAVLNYTQAIKCHPQDDESYFRRAKMHEERHEHVLAMEDYAKAFCINPGRTDALLTHALMYVHNSNWLLALEKLSLLLEQEPHHGKARTHRARVYVKLGKLQEALEDFALALHLDPNNWQAFYHRGCLLQRNEPRLALRDLSTSILINDSVENLSSFLHRGLIYAELKLWQQAISDFKAVIKLDSSVAVAHLNLGLIYMLKKGQNQKAIRMFTSALTSDPTYIRGYICRAQAYHRVNEFQRALRDVTRAIHMTPDSQNLYIIRGQYLCDMKHFELAKFCIHHAAEMNTALGSSPIQQAAVQSFLGNKMKAITCLVKAIDACPSLPLLLLLGKTQMKAQMFLEAVDSFRKALALLSLNTISLLTGSHAAEISYLTGLCYMAQAQQLQDTSLFLQALDAFSTAVNLSPDHADAYHQRGICCMHLKQPKSIQDLNRALSLNPTLFQAYLSRAALFGAEGRYTKAILNCNEAIKIQPNSVRAYLCRGVFKFHMKGYKGAVQDLTIAINIDSTCSLAYYNRGVCHQLLKEYALALKDYGIVLLLASKKETELKVLVNRGLLYLELNENHNALQDFKTASQKSPEDTTIYHALGVLHHRLGQLQESTEAYSQALRLNPFFLDAYIGRGNAFMDYGHVPANKQAQRDFLSALHLNPLCSSARISLGYNLQVFGFFQRAWNQFTVAVDIQPECWAALEGRAVVSLQMGHTYAAFQDISVALRKYPLSDQLLTNRGVVNEFMGDKVSAMRDYQKAISQNHKCALAYFNAANLYFQNRQFSEACSFYSRAAELDPGDESVFLNRAITYALLRKVPEALHDFSEALRLNPFSSQVFFNRANLYSSLKKYHSAERDLTEALCLQPNDALVYKLRADVRGHLGLTELAISDYKMALQIEEAIEP